MIRAMAEGVTRPDIFPNHNKCIVHFLDLNVNLTKDYLKSAWTAESIGSNDFYLANVEDINHLATLNYSNNFDFQRLFITTLSKVSFASSLNNLGINNMPS